MPGMRYTAEVRQQAIARALDPQTSIAQVAHEVGCSLETINRWLRQHRQRDASPPTLPDKTTFVPVNIIDDRNHHVEIVTSNGITIRLADVSPRYVAELLNAIASC